jgi:hypothetical protein
MQRVLFLIQTFMLIYTMRYWLARRGLTATAGTTFIRAILTLISIIEFMFWSWCLFEVLFVLKCLKRPIRWCCWRLMNGLNNTSMLKHKHNTTKQQIEVTWCLEVVAVWEDADDRTQHYFDDERHQNDITSNNKAKMWASNECWSIASSVCPLNATFSSAADH